VKIEDIAAFEVRLRLDLADCRLLARVCERAAGALMEESESIIGAAVSSLGGLFLAAGHAATALNAFPTHSPHPRSADCGHYAGDEYTGWPVARDKKEAPPAT